MKILLLKSLKFMSSEKSGDLIDIEFRVHMCVCKCACVCSQKISIIGELSLYFPAF